MYFFYTDESGTPVPLSNAGSNGDLGTGPPGLYVVAAVSLLDRNWHRFDKAINVKKRELLRVAESSSISSPPLRLLDCEVKSTTLRHSKERKKSPFLANLTDEQRTDLAKVYYEQLPARQMRVFAVVIDKRCLHAYMDKDKVQSKAWELLLEMAERYLVEEQPSHRGIMVADDVSKQQNRRLASKHQFLQAKGTKSGVWLNRLVELPLFVASELSNGVQLADLVAYNVFRQFSWPDQKYAFFERCLPQFWSLPSSGPGVIDGLRVFPPESPLQRLLPTLAAKRNGPEPA
jgi:hypothetical protein